MAEKLNTITSWEKQSLDSILTKNVRVPLYQRAYSWDKENIEDFVKDYDDFLNSKYDAYLFGQMIFHVNGDELEIIDGQQRLTTTVIFLSVLRKLATEFEIDYLDDYKKNIEELIGKVEYGNDNFHLTLGKTNRDYFLQRVQHENYTPAVPKDESNKLINQAYNQMYDYYREKLEGKRKSEVLQILRKYKDTLISKFYVSCIKTNDLSQAYIVFETLNSRGKDLDAADLLKNYFFKVCDAKQWVIDGWEKMIDTFNSINEPPTNFIRCYWNSKYVHYIKDGSFVRKKGLFRAVTTYIDNDSVKAFNFLREMYSLVDTYVAVLQPGIPGAISDETLKGSLQCLKDNGLRSFYPLMLALKIGKCTDLQISRFIYDVEVLLFRNIILGNETANAYETTFSEYACEISKGVNLKQVQDKIIDNTYSDEQFQTYFMNYVSKADSTAKNVLRELYNYGKGERPVKPNNRQIQLEHIMPQKPDAEWNVDPEFHKSNLNRLGNLTLLLDKLNESASNNVLELKKKDYCKSEIIETHVLEYVSTSEWNAKMIEDRQLYLFETAKKRWEIRDVSKRNAKGLAEDNLWKAIMEKALPPEPEEN